MTATLYSWDLMPSGSAVATSSNTTVGNALPILRDLAIDLDSGELQLDGGDLKGAYGVASIQQHVCMRLRTLLGEWFLDTSRGVPYFEQVLTKNPSNSVLAQVFREAILSTVGVSSLLQLDLSVDTRERTLMVSFKADTDLGEITGAVPVGV